MPGKTDDVLIESVAAHRKRLKQAFLLGGIAERRAVDNGLKSTVVSFVLAAVMCAGCVGFSFVQSLLAANANPAGAPTAASTVPTGGDR